MLMTGQPLMPNHVWTSVRGTLIVSTSHSMDGQDSSCLGFANCEEFDETSCQDCYSGSRDCEDVMCSEVGRCEGILIDNFASDSHDDCLTSCQLDMSCQWLTYNSDDSMCVMLEDCQTFETDCSTCLTSQRLCTGASSTTAPPDTTSADSPAYTKLAVIGGYNFVFGGNLVDAEVLDLEDSRTNCDNLANYPAPETGLTAALIDGIIKSCGGHQSDTKACHDYSAEEQNWSEAPDMIHERVYPRSSIIQGQWLISGDNQSPANVETEIWNGSEFELGPVLPTPMYHPCQLTLNDTHIFIADMEHHDGFYILNWQTGEWSEQMDMDRTRTWPACGVVRSEENGLEVVIVGEGTSDILNLESLEWREGPGLPYGFDYGYTQMGDTFVLVGGYDGNYLDTVYLFDNDNYVWVQLDQTLKTPRYLPAVVAIPDSFTDCA